MNYKTTVTKIGDMARDFISENIIIIFNDNAPEELGEICFLHSIEEFTEDVKIGDIMKIGKSEYTVTAVGDEANKTLQLLGHCTLKFTGESKVELPGQLMLKGASTPDIKIGDTIEIIYK